MTPSDAESLTDAEVLLCRWGDWSRRNSDIGYSRISTIGKMMKEGGGAGYVSIAAGLAMPDDIAHAERIVCLVSIDIKRSLKAKYIWGLTERDAAEKFGCSRITHRQRIKNGIMFLAGSFCSAA